MAGRILRKQEKVARTGYGPGASRPAATRWVFRNRTDILHIIATLDPQSGGSAEMVRVLIDHSPEDCSSEIVTLDDPSAAFLKEAPVAVHALGPATSTYGSTKRLLS
jgi:hypothetical protein